MNEQKQLKHQIINCRSKTNRDGDSIFLKYVDVKTGKIKEHIIQDFEWYFGIKKKDEEEVVGYLTECQDRSGREILYDVRYSNKYPGYSLIYLKNFYHPKTGKKMENRYSIVRELEKTLGITTYEGDLSSDKRWYVDKDILVADSKHFKKLYFDIETDDTNRMIRIGKDRILSFGAIDNTGKTFFLINEDHESDEAEARLLQQMTEVVCQYDIIMGWNSKGFDIPYIRGRMDYHDMKFDYFFKWIERASYDLLARSRHIYRFDSNLRKFSLDYIANHFLGEGKVERPEKIIDLYKNNREKLEKYNLIDSILVKKIDEKNGISDMMIQQARWCGVPPKRFGLYSIIDTLILKKAHGLGKMGRTSSVAIDDNEKGLQSKKIMKKSSDNPDDVDTVGSKYMGAAVLDPVPGMYDNVHSFDFKSLYPTIMRSSNIGYDSISLKNGTGFIRNPGTATIKRKSGEVIPTYFRKTPSVIALTVEELMTKRKEYKTLKLDMIGEHANHGPEWEKIVSDEIIVKELSNSTYGIMGLSYGRYFSIDVAESITLMSQWCLHSAKDFYNKSGYDTIYGDTDSIFVAIKGKVNLQKTLDEYHKSITKDLKNNYNIDNHCIELEFERKFKKFVLIAKKTYFGRVLNVEGKETDEIYARGMDYIKKNVFEFAREKQKELVDVILYKEKGAEYIKKWLTKVKKEFDGKEFDAEYLSLISKINKEFKQYKTKTLPLHVRLAKEHYEKTGETLVGSEIEYIVTHTGRLTHRVKDENGKMVDKETGDIQMGVMTKDWDGIYNKDFYWIKKTKPLFKRILDAAFPDEVFFPKPPRKIKKKKVIKKKVDKQLELDF